MLLWALGCFGGSPEEGSGARPVVEVPGATKAGAVPGVSEVVTPPEILRAAELRDDRAPATLDVWFEADRTTAAGLRKLLEDNGFTVLDGDGESWRVRAPAGQQDWEGMLARLPEVRSVRDVAVALEALPSGNLREGLARYPSQGGEILLNFHFREGGPQQTVTGLRPPPADAVFPTGAPPQLVRCLLPAREQLQDGIPAGPGWERALTLEPRAWVLVLEGYGPCEAQGWLVMHPSGRLDTLTVGGANGSKPAEAPEALWWESAARWLQTPRPEGDATALAAFDLLRGAPDERMAALLPGLAPGALQRRLFDQWHARSPEAALAAASGSPALLARAATVSAEARAKIIADPAAPSLALIAALPLWRPGPQEDPAPLERLTGHADPAVRRLARERLMEIGMSACTGRAAQIPGMAVEALAQLYRDCPQQPVRSPAFQALAAKDRDQAAALVRATLEDPETLLTGIAAVRAANALERDDLLSAAVARDSLDRDVRRAALETLVKAGRDPKAPGVAAQYGAYLGYKAPAPATAGG